MGLKRRPIQRRRLQSRGSKAKRDAKHARNFGEEADRVRAMEYCVCSEVARDCFGPIVAAHDPSRGAGGGRMNLYNACVRHHDEQHSIGIGSFRAKYGLDTIAIGDAIALGHTDGLGIRGLAARFVREEPPEVGVGGELLEDPIYSMLLDTYERDALLGWVRRWAVGRGPSEHDDPDEPDPRGLLATDLADDLHLEDDDAAFALLHDAGAFEGWPT